MKKHLPLCLKIAPAKPRNPFVAAARQRAAGAHRPQKGGLRHQAKQALMRELNVSQRSASP